MLHNKYYELLKQFLGDYGKEIYGRKLIGQVKMSQKGIALALEELEEKNILKSRKEGAQKYYYINRKNTEIKDIITIVEIMRKLEFMSKERIIARLFNFDSRMVGIFGSYAKSEQGKGSDMDIFIIGSKRKHDYDQKGKSFDAEVSIKYFSEAEWKTLLKERNNLALGILSGHVLVFGFERFIEMAWDNYYGYD